MAFQEVPGYLLPLRRRAGVQHGPGVLGRLRHPPQRPVPPARAPAPGLAAPDQRGAVTVARSTRTAQPKVRFVKQYANWAGNVFRRYEAPDGRVAEVRVREDYQGRYEYTN